MADNIVFTRREKRILLIIKSLYALTWGFLNAVTFMISSRYATMMTGNLIQLAVEVAAWRVEEMLLTASLIAAYIFGGVAYEALDIVVDDEYRVLAVAMPAVVVMGVVGDVWRYTMQSCAGGEKCDGRYLFFLTPISFMTGIVAGGYCNSHQDGVMSILMTGHMRVAPNALLQMYLPGRKNGVRAKEAAARIVLRERAVLSMSMITAYFCGVLAGDIVEDLVRERYWRHEFSPVFTPVGLFLAATCMTHSQLCKRFSEHHRRKEAKAEKIERASVLVTNAEMRRIRLMWGAPSDLDEIEGKEYDEDNEDGQSASQEA